MDKHNKSFHSSITSEADPTHLIEYAEKHARDADKWFRIMWAQYLWLTGIGWVLTMAVPFGLALILYLPNESSRATVSIIFIAVSACGIFCQILASVLRLRERSLTNKKIWIRLDRAVRLFRTKDISIEQLQKQIDVAMKIEEDEIAP